MLAVFLLLFFPAIWSAKEEDFNLSKYHQSVYLRFENGEMKRVFNQRTTLYQLYFCAYGFRQTYLPNSDNLDFDKLATTYALCYFQILNAIFLLPQWIELYGNRDVLKLPKFSDLRVRLSMNDVKFSKKDTISKNVELSLRNVIENSRSETSASITVEHKVERVTTAKATSTHAWKHERSLEVGVKDPITDSGASVKMSMFASGTSGSSNSDSDSVTYSVTDTCTVPPHKTGRLIWTKSESNAQMGWSAHIEVTGWIAVKYTDSLLYFFPVSDMAYVFDEYVTRLGENTIGVRVAGTLEMNDAVISDAVVDEYDISKKDANCPGEFTNFTLPRSLIH